MSRSRHSSTEYFGSPRLWSPNSSTRLPVKSLIGEIELNASINPSEMNHLNDAFCSSIRSGRLRTSGIFANVKRLRGGPGSSGSSTVNASSGTTKEALAMFCALIAVPFAAGSAAGAGGFLLRGGFGFSRRRLGSHVPFNHLFERANVRNAKKARSPHDEGEGPRSFPRYPPIGIGVHVTPGAKPGQPSSGGVPGPGSGAQARPGFYGYVTDRCLGCPNDINGRIKGGRPVTAAMARSQ